MSTTVDLPDLTVWLALACPGHSHNHQALRYWEQPAAEQVLFCTVTALGLVRLLCQPKLMGAAVRPQEKLPLCWRPSASNRA